MPRITFKKLMTAFRKAAGLPTQTQLASLQWLRRMNIKTVLDVGAHKGESALWLHQALPEAQIYSFEPQKKCFVELVTNLKHVPNFQAFNVALGVEDSRQSIYLSSYTPSSSLLEMAPLHKETHPHSADTATQETIEIRSLDSMAKEEIVLEANILLKMDAQGYENRVLLGAKDTLDQVTVVLTEMLFQELYKDQAQFADIYEILHAHGFTYRGSWSEGRRSASNGLQLYADGIFVRAI